VGAEKTERSLSGAFALLYSACYSCSLSVCLWDCHSENWWMNYCDFILENLYMYIYVCACVRVRAVLKRLATPSEFLIPLPSVVPFTHS
jgi:hypothetical protein